MEQALAGGSLQGLINNAAVFNRTTLAESSRETFLAEWRPNLLGPLELMRAFAAQTDQGCILNLLDRRIAAHDAGAMPYHLSKTALAEATRLAAIEFSPGIRVNGIAPGPILPPPGHEHEANYLKQHGGRTLLDHGCSPQDIADAARYLFGAPAVTGQVIFIDAGQHLLGNGV
jgi:NAD(P)-dependent dehydrogenase (short-subunit alcohol dehydrogenase family)